MTEEREAVRGWGWGGVQEKKWNRQTIRRH
jgi:hypothetical protein